jgi:hypothetical protein
MWNQAFFHDLNTSSLHLLDTLATVAAPLSTVISVVNQLQDPGTGVAAVAANLSIIVDPSRCDGSDVSTV